MSWSIENVCGHYEVYSSEGNFLFSADTWAEVMEERHSWDAID